MPAPHHRERIGIVGGTGPLGRGLAARWALAGHEVHIGSRTADKAVRVAGDVEARIADRAGVDVTVHGSGNADAIAATDLTVVAVPYEAQAGLLGDLREVVGDRIVCNVVNPMTFDDVGPRAVPVEAGSAAEECQRLWPEATVVSAFHDVSSRRLWRVDEPITTHVLICGDDVDAAHRVAHLAAVIEGMWGVYCGPLRNSAYVENITPILLFVNRYYRIQAGVLIDGLERDPERLHAHRAE